MKNTIYTSDLSQKELILSLIKADMRNNKLITGLEGAGALVEDFYSDLGAIILRLVDFHQPDSDELYEFYSKTRDRLINVELSVFNEKLNYLALDFYNELLIEKIKSKSKKVA